MIIATNCFFQGEFVQVQTYTDRIINLYDPEQHRGLVFQHGEDPKLHCSCWAALALWSLGYPDQARERMYHALHFARELAHPYEFTFTLFWAAFLHYNCGEVQSTHAQLEVLLPLTREHGILPTATLGTVLLGWVLSEQGHRDEGIVQIQQSLEGLQAMGLGLGRLYCLTLLAEAYSKVGQVAEGQKVLTEALDIVHKCGEWTFQAELYRLKGELTRQQESREQGAGSNRSHKSRVGSGKQEAGSQEQGAESRKQESEACFLKAIEIAQKQHAKSLELRAAVSLARLWHHQGKQKEARELLVEIYTWFTEGFETKDLQEAKVLLEEIT